MTREGGTKGRRDEGTKGGTKGGREEGREEGRKEGREEGRKVVSLDEWGQIGGGGEWKCSNVLCSSSTQMKHEFFSFPSSKM